MTSFFGASSGRPRSSCSSVNMYVITSLWEGRATFCCFVSAFADFTAWNNKTDGSSDFIGQEQCVKANSGDRATWQGREITHGLMFKGGLQAEREEELPESLVWWATEHVMKTGRYLSTTKGMGQWNEEKSPSEMTVPFRVKHLWSA